MSAQNKAPSRLSTALLALITTKQLLTVVVTALVTGAVILGVSGLFQGEPAQSESGAVKLGFEDIGELATQSAYCTQVSVTQADRELFGISIPFTQSKYIYSYNVEIQAGFDFGEITYTVDEESGTIRVQLPAPRVLSSEIDLDSFQLYHEEESIFRKITLEENNAALVQLQQEAEETAVANGLLEQAGENGRVILTGFFEQADDLEEYDLIFEDR